VVVVVFFELGLFFEKQLLNHPTPCRICRDFEHCPIVLNVLPDDEMLQKTPPQPRLALALDQNSLRTLGDYFRMDKVSNWKSIATAPAGADLELSIYDEGEYHALVFPCRRDGSSWRDVPMPLQPTHWRLWVR
jgi:hypothetical protein